MFKGLIFGVMLSTYVLTPDGHMTLSGDAVPITKPADDNYFDVTLESEIESEEEAEYETEEEMDYEETLQADPENITVTLSGNSVLDDVQFSQILKAINSLSADQIPETESETEFNPEISVLSLNESGLTGVPKTGVAIYKGTFNGTQGFLMYPYDYADRLAYDDSGLLINVSGATVSGRFFVGDTLDLSNYRAKLYLLDSIYNQPSNLYRYGSYGVMRTYREYNNNLTYDSVYGNFYVSELYIYEPQNDSHKTYLLVAGIFFVVCAVLIFRRKSE